VTEYPKFSDFADIAAFDGDKLKLGDILDKTILVMGYAIKDSKKKQDTKYVTIHFKLDNKPHVVFTASQVLIDQLTKYKDKIPFYAAIKKINNYYTFS
jgi:hypothetical protein